MAANRSNNFTVKRTIVGTRNRRHPGDGYKNLWSDLPSDVVELILNRIRLTDIFQFIRVSKSWKSHRKDLLGFQPPHVIVLSVLANRNLQLENVFGGSTFDVKLPRFIGRRCYGFTSGYLLLEDRKNLSGVHLVNPLTHLKYELQFAKVSPHCVLIGTADMDPSVTIIIAISNIESSTVKHSVLQIYWYNMPHVIRMFSSIIAPVVCMDAAIFNAKIYVITEQGQTGVMKLSYLTLELSEIENTPSIQFLSSSPRLVVSDKNLILVDFLNINQFKIYELDSVKMIWKMMLSLGDRALFISDSTSFAICETRHWSGNSNCIYSICYDTNRCKCYAFDGGLVESYPIGERMKASKSGLAKPLWYFPDEACDSIPSLSLSIE